MTFFDEDIPEEEFEEEIPASEDYEGLEIKEEDLFDDGEELKELLF